ASLTVTTTGNQPLKTVFLIMMENHNWSDITSSSSAPYINNTLLAIGAHATQYFNPPGIHPSLPNYLWLEAGTNFGISADDSPSTAHQSTTMHLVTLLKNANITWKATHVPVILNSAAYKQGGVIFITWDEGEGGSAPGDTKDGPIGMMVLSPNAKVGYQNSIHYDHSSTLRTVEEIFKVSPMLGGAANQTDLSDLFTSFP